MTIEELIISINELENKKSLINEQLDALNVEIESKKSELLNQLKTNQLNEVEAGDLCAHINHTETIGYSSDADVINYLKDNGYSQFVKEKVTYSLDKRPLSKELKTNEKLKESLDSFLTTKITESVTVMTKENREKQLTHINEGKEK